MENSEVHEVKILNTLLPCKDNVMMILLRWISELLIHLLTGILVYKIILYGDGLKICFPC